MNNNVRKLANQDNMRSQRLLHESTQAITDEKAEQMKEEAKEYTDINLSQHTNNSKHVHGVGNSSVESVEGAQIKAEAAASEAKNYTDQHEIKSNPHDITTSKIGAETPEEAQNKADTAENNSKNYTDAHADHENPHEITPDKIEAETPDEAQLKADIAQEAAKEYADQLMTSHIEEYH